MPPPPAPQAGALGLAARQSVVLAGQYRAHSRLHCRSWSGRCRRLLRFFVLDAVWSGSDRDACLATAAQSRRPAPAGRSSGSGCPISSMAFIRSANAGGSTRSSPRSAFGIGWLAWLGGAAPRYRRGLFLCRAAGSVLCAVKRRTGSRACQGFDLAVGRRSRHHRGRDGRHRGVLAARHRCWRSAGAPKPRRSSCSRSASSNSSAACR